MARASMLASRLAKTRAMRTASASVSDHSEASNFFVDAPLATASSAARLRNVVRASALASALGAGCASASLAVCARSSSRTLLSASTTLTADAASSAASTDDRPSRAGAPSATPAASEMAARNASTFVPYLRQAAASARSAHQACCATLDAQEGGCGDRDEDEQLRDEPQAVVKANGEADGFNEALEVAQVLALWGQRKKRAGTTRISGAAARRALFTTHLC